VSASNKVIHPFPSIAAGDISDDITGASSSVQGMSSAIYYIEWSGTTVDGVLNIEFLKASRLGNSTTEGDVWEKLEINATIGTDIPIATDSGSHALMFSELPFTALRPIYIANTGTGTITVTLIAKGF
jgi:hypothetical protein